MWRGVVCHVVNKHSWLGGRCDHLPLDEGSQNKPWLRKGNFTQCLSVVGIRMGVFFFLLFLMTLVVTGGADHEALIQVVLDKRWLDQVKKFLNFR